MLRAMFGMGASEILVILVVALLFLGPEKLPEAAQKISKGIRDIRKQTRELTQTIENDAAIGGAIRDLKSALRGDEIRPRAAPPGRPAPPPVPAPDTKPAITEPPAAGEPAPAAEAAPVAEAEPEVAIKPAPGIVAKGDEQAS